MKKNDKFRKIMSNILSKFTANEMVNCLTELNKNLFSDYESVDFFFNILIENFKELKQLQYFINQKLFDIISLMFDIKKYKKQELLNNECFRKIIFKIFLLILNTDGKYNPKNYFELFDKIKEFLNEVKDDIFFIEIFKIFFVELYDFSKYKNEDNEIIIKYQFLNNCKDYQNFANLKIKALDSVLFNYLENIILLFTSFTPVIQIINFFKNYFNIVYYMYYQTFLMKYNCINYETKSNEDENDYFLCNFFHIFQSNNICYKYYFYLIDYAKKLNNLQIFELFPDIKATLMNIYILCPSPFYFDFIIDILKNFNENKENELYFKEIIDMILNIETMGRNNIYKMHDYIENKYKNYYFNTIHLIKIFYYFSQDPNIYNIFNYYQLKVYIIQLVKNLKKNFYIFSDYLIKLDDNNSQKSILEMCFNIIISIFHLSKEDSNNELYELFLDDNLKNIDNNGGKSIIFIFDIFNNLLGYKNEIKMKKEDYHNKEFEYYLSEIKDIKKEEKSLLIVFIIKIYLLKNQNNNNNIFIDNCWDLLINDLLILINKYSPQFKKTKKDHLYDLIIDMINNMKKNNHIIEKDNIIFIIEKIFNENKNDQILKLVSDVDYSKLLELLKNDENSACILNEKCLISNLTYESFSSFELIEDSEYINLLNSYFDIDMLNVVKCLRKDLLLKDCSIYFNDIYFKDKNFNKIKNSYFYNYKEYLSNETNDKFLNYPSKLKNFSSGKYATPKIFLTYDINLYNKNFFSVIYPKFKKNLLKNKSFPSLPNHYEYYQNLLLNNDDNLILQSFNCEFISIKQTIFGQIDLYEKFIIFKNKDNFGDFSTSINYIYSNNINEVTLNKKIIIINYNEIEEIIKRAFVYNPQALEIFLKNGKSYFFNLFDPNNFDIFFGKINVIKNNQKLNFTFIKEPKNEFDKKGYTKQWENDEINNYQYLLYLNKFSGRSFNDSNQYPIFPWILLNENYFNLSEENIKDKENDNKSKESNNYKLYFRDMNYFMMTQTENGREKAIECYENNEGESPDKGYHFSLHYSTSGYILLYLMRISPFMDQHIRFQGGKFDVPNRLINNMNELLDVMKDFKDNRELIPEFFTTIEYFYNLNFNFFGIRKNTKTLINNMDDTSLFKSLSDYIYYNRIFLNNRFKDKNKNIPSCQIYDWINLVFGYKQYPTSLQNLNKFEKYTYRQNVSLPKLYEKYKKKELTTEKIVKKIHAKGSRIINFGQCPEQLFNSKHKYYKIDSLSYFSRSNEMCEFNDNNIKIITFWLSENQSNIYFLAKNKENKNMSILIYDEKCNKKCKILIDKIKLFNEKNDYNKKEKEKSGQLNKNDRLRRKLKSKSLDFQSFYSKNSFEYYSLNDKSELYILNPKDAIIDISDCDNAYFFIGRNKDNTLKIYEEFKNNGKLFGLIKTDSFISVLHKKDKKSFFTGHKNGKLIEWEINYKEINRVSKRYSFRSKENKPKVIIDNIIFKRELIAHNFSMITSIYYCQKHNVILTSDDEGFLYIRKYYDFEFLTKIQINQKDNSSFINKIYVNDYDVICLINYNKIKYNNYICLFSLNGLLLEISDYYLCGDTSILKNGKIIFNCLNKNNLFIFGFNRNDNKEKKIMKAIEDNILKNISNDSITNFVIENNIIYILLKNGKFIKIKDTKFDSLLYGVDYLFK